MESGVAQDIESLGSAGGSDQQHRDLLQQMINEGLNPSSEISPHDEAKYRRLLQVLFESCIVKPSHKPLTPIAVDRATLTIAVLFKLAGPKPSIFSRLPEGEERPVPLFKWIIPRLIDAASRWIEVEEGRELAGRVVNDIVKVIGLMRRDEVGRVGDGQVAVLLRQLQEFCTDLHEKKASSLFGYALHPSPAVLLVTLKVLLQTRYPLTDNAAAMANLLLADYTRSMLPRKELNGPLIDLILSAIEQSAPQTDLLSPACAALLRYPDIDLRPFFAGIKPHLTLRYEVWRALLVQAEKLSLPLDTAKIIQLLTPIEQGVLSYSEIRDSLPSLLVEQWRADAEQLPDTDQARLYSLLAQKELPSPLSSKKRKRDEVGEQPALALLRESFPESSFAGDNLFAELARAVSTADNAKLAGMLPQICELCPSHTRDDIVLWLRLASKVSGSGALWRAFKMIHDKHHAADSGREFAPKIWNVLSSKLASRDRRERVLAGRALCQIKACDDNIWATAIDGEMVLRRLSKLSTGMVAYQETALSTVGALARYLKKEDLCTALEILLQRLSASTSSPIRNVAVTELHAIAHHHGKTPYGLVYPFLDRISVAIIRNIRSRPDIVTEALHFLGQNRQSFISTTLNYTVPALVCEGDATALHAIASVIKTKLSELLVEKATEILTHILLQRHPRANQKLVPPMQFLVNTIRETIDMNQVNSITAATLINSCHMLLAVNLIIELGDDDKRVQQLASRALHEAQRIKDPKRPDDLGAFLKPVMLGILTHLNDTLHEIKGKKSVAEKRKLIRSLGALIKLVGDSMSSYSPQIMQSLQSTLVLSELRQETLNTWGIFVATMRFADFGPFVGRTTGALVANWADFNAAERSVAAKIINDIVGNARELKPYLDEIVGLDGIPELAQIGAALMESRRRLKPQQQLEKILDRASSQNTAIATTSLRELKAFMVAHQNDLIAQYSMGDTFDAMVPAIMQTLLAASTREGECDDLRMLAYECIGIIGALDPDRFTLPAEAPPFTITSNFTDHDESQDFALHLVRDLLVDAFRATSDTKLQGYLAYAMQELLKFCDFGPELLGQSGIRTSKKGEKAVSANTKKRWDKLPKDQIEIVAPLLDTRFDLADIQLPQTEHPIYPIAPSYRDWLHRWTADLIRRVMAQPTTKANKDCQDIFGAFRGVLKHQDVAVSHRLLPHLVLHVLIMGDPVASFEIKQEINVVLQDQVNGLSMTGASGGNDANGNPTGVGNKRMFSSQLIFDLMDHISRWLQIQHNKLHALTSRANKLVRTHEAEDKKAVQHEAAEISQQTSKVGGVLNTIEVEMVAKAALQSKAYARSLRNFEQRMIDLRTGKEKFGNDRLQVYFERLHEIYAALDEPDGMEGVSTYVIAPSLEHQIREHESTGRWTSAQSCWEVRLQQNQDEVGFHIGLLKCLQNLGHYDTLQTHIRGVLSVRPEWTHDLAEYQAEAAWITGDWTRLEQLGDLGGPMGPVLSGLQKDQPVAPLLEKARRCVGQGIISKDYARNYDVVLKLHQLREIELVWDAKAHRPNPATMDLDDPNAAVVARKARNDFVQMLQQRFDTTSPGFRVREAILTIRRTALSLVDVPDLRDEIGRAWIQSSRIARKAGYEQTAYTAALQAKQVDAPFAFVQQVKLVKGSDGVFKALTSLENSVKPIKDEIDRQNELDKRTKKVRSVEEKEECFARDRQLAKASLLEARWARETDRFSVNDVVAKFKEASSWDTVLESPYYHLGHYYDTLEHTSLESQAQANQQTVSNYILALKYGVKYIYQTMPRMLTLWLDLGEKEAAKKTAASTYLGRITKLINNARNDLPAYQFLTAFPQIVSRIGHPNKEIHHLLRKIMALVIQEYPKQALWPTVGVMQSNRAERKAACEEVLKRAQTIAPHISSFVREAEKLSSALLRLANDTTGNDKRELSVKATYQYLLPALPSKMIMPLQDALTPSLPISSGMIQSHNPFPYEPVTIMSIHDKIEIMPSLQRPKKIVFIGSDGLQYPMLCKPHDDLRKDARLMDFNSMINKLLKSASESRRRRLYIRTYAVMPLNEECGLLEWVSDTSAFKRILDKEYGRFGKKLYTNELHSMLEQSRKAGPKKQVEVFENKVIPLYSPSVFQAWFVQTWPEPSAWLAARMAYSRTLAVMSMIGHVLGLGDRHGENILFDSITGDTVHVDLNCLFEKGKTFEIPERVPFRLTHNMVDALGVTGVEGVFRKAAEIAMGILRSNSDSLMSVLEAFAHDPLVEWSSRSGRAKSERDIRVSAERNLAPIRAKLRGANTGDATINSVPGQVDKLIKEATSSDNLAVMYQGWAPYL